ncbi:hypothetical protein [uncultured Dokdonia sp.]|uniref:hypothetical protein n=1 Tax=uncultured Dokdonia sp. TaxID=575653 RepID=UPI00261A8BB3|nr:hypothetical protein [uncultured Dokdonia sp.]
MWEPQSWLINNATTAELERLIEYDNSAVRAIAFEALLQKKHPNIFDYIVNSEDYKKLVYIETGCMGSAFGLTEYYLFMTYDRSKRRYKSNLFSKEQITILNRIANRKNRYLIN